MSVDEAVPPNVSLPQWWQARTSLYPSLAHAAMAALCPCHSAVVESSFSRMTGLTMDRRREMMTVRTKEARLFVFYNGGDTRAPPPAKRRRAEPAAGAASAARSADAV